MSAVQEQRVALRQRVLSSLKAERVAIVVILLLHVMALWRFFPPSEVFRSEPLQFGDHPIHTYRVHMYREGLREGGLPWGYDPAISTGTVMNPGQDLGSKPQQILGALLPFLPPGTIVRLFLFIALLSAPVWICLACRLLGISTGTQAWVLLIFLSSLWLLQEGAGYWHAGLASFSISAFFSVYVLAVFLDFLARPAKSSYMLLLISSTFVFFLHVLGALIIFPVLAVLTLSNRSISWSWRGLLLAMPLFVVLLNAYWFIPYMSAQHIPWPVGMQPVYPPDAVQHLHFNEVSEVIALLSNPRRLVPLLLRLGLAIYGVVVLKRTIGKRAAYALGAACAIAFMLTYSGSFLPLVVKFQTVRFEVHLLTFLSILAGAGFASLVSQVRLPVGVSGATVAVGLAIVIALFRPRPHPLVLPSPSDPLTTFITANTMTEDRLMVQARDGYKGGWYETKIFPLLSGREVIGSNFQVIYDPPQFLKTMLMGREVNQWEPADLRETLARWGISWVFTVTPEAHELMEATLGPPEYTAGEYRVFRISEKTGRFLAGSGKVRPKINRIELTDLESEEGLVVLRYRYNPGFKTDSGLPVYQYAVPEDSMGFIALKDPPSSVTLTFDQWGMLSAPWPDVDSELRVAPRNNSLN